MRKKNIEVVKDFGEVNIPEKWEDVTLKQYMKLHKLVEESEDGKVDKYQLISIFIDKDYEDIMQMPIKFVDLIASKLMFVNDPIDTTPKNEIIINDKQFTINYAEQLTVKEYEDVDTVIRNDPNNIAAIMAIMCRMVVGKKTDAATLQSWIVNEKYDSDFANLYFDKRVEMFENQSITKILPVLAFFLIKSEISMKYSANFIQEMKTQVNHYVDDIESSAMTMGFKRLFMIPQMMKLKKLKKLANSI